MKLLRIPNEHDRRKNYPMAGKMTNEKELLDLIILSSIDILNKVDKYIQKLPNPDSYNDIYNFIKIINLFVFNKLNVPRLYYWIINRPMYI